MKKVPTIFKRDPNNRRFVIDEPSGPDVSWVFAGDGVQTRKYDGTACLIKDGTLYKRYELRPGKVAPDSFMPAQEPDPVTGKQPGWVLVGDGPEDKYHRSAYQDLLRSSNALSMYVYFLEDGTYELVGPKINGNKDSFETHQLVNHKSAEKLHNVEVTWGGIKDYLSNHQIEGIVWHHPDGRWAKIKRRDFGLPW